MKKKIGYLGSGAWGICLANLLAKNGHDVQIWSATRDILDYIEEKKEHPKFPGIPLASSLRGTTNLEELIQDKDLLVESVTTKGFRSVLQKMTAFTTKLPPLVITSKGIEIGTGLLLPEIALEILGEQQQYLIGCLTGPSLAQEVMQEMPASVVAAAFDLDLMQLIQRVFTTPYFRVYPNVDVFGAAFGGAMKNIIAIACGISDGLGFGQNAKAALLTRGLHEMRKLAPVKNCLVETLNGLSGLGDLATTCLSTLSRNYTFGKLLAEGKNSESAKNNIGMVVEGVSTCVSVRELGHKYQIPLPITESIYSIIYENKNLSEVVKVLLTREIKEEYL